MARKEEKDGPPKRYRKPSALKHGGFSVLELFPWENSGAFESLHRDLIEQYQPRGPLQEDCIQTITSLMWRKGRIRDKRVFDIRAELDRTENHVLWEHPIPLMDTDFEISKYELANCPVPPRSRPLDEYESLLHFSNGLYRDRASATIVSFMIFIPAEFREHLKENVPVGNYETTREWVVALKMELDGVLLPMARKRHPAANGYFEAAAKLLNDERTHADLALEERFDAAIDKALKRLFSLQMAEQLSTHRAAQRVPLQLSKPAVLDNEPS